jgi:hypothetical protein
LHYNKHDVAAGERQHATHHPSRRIAEDRRVKFRRFSLGRRMSAVVKLVSRP